MLNKHFSHKHYCHGIRVAAIGVLSLALLVAQFHSWPILTEKTEDGQVLSYATAVSRDGLLDNTNQARTQHDHQELRISKKLNRSAQSKAEAMIASDYWSHVSPTGVKPWKFFKQVGYDYSRAGENLAYGFDTSDQVVAAWMGSTSHRANLLGNYTDVGFGIANGRDYQDGRYTIVVAHYGLPVSASGQVAGEHESSPPAVTTGSLQSVSYWQQLTHGQVPTILAASLGLCLGAALMFAFSHRRMLARAIEDGEHFALRHPLLDTCLAFLVVGLILTSQSGTII